MEPPSRGDADDAEEPHRRGLPLGAGRRPGALRPGPVHGYRDIDGVDPASTTETYAALRLDIDNWRWSGVPFFIRTGKLLPATQTEIRVVFRRPPRLGFGFAHRPEPNQIVIKLDPTTGIRFQRRRPQGRPRPRARADHARHGVRRAGRRGRHPLRGAAARRARREQHAVHPPGRRRGGVADHGAAAGGAAAGPSVRPGYLGSRGGRRRWSPSTAAGTSRGWTHEHRAGTPERGGPVAVPAHRGVRLPLRLPHGGAGRAQRLDRLAVRAALRRAERVRQPARPARPASSASSRSASTTPPPGPTSRGRTCW